MSNEIERGKMCEKSKALFSLCLMQLSSKILQNVPYFWIMNLEMNETYLSFHILKLLHILQHFTRLFHQG